MSTIINGRNIIGSVYVDEYVQMLKAFDPAKKTVLEGDFFKATPDMISKALEAATNDFENYRNIGKDQRALFLTTIAEEITAFKEDIIRRGSSETGLPAARLQGELQRTANQLLLFADLVKEGSWVRAVIDHADATRQPVPKPDIRNMLVPLGPVVIFGAGNFPLAFSVAGGDTASALAAGCPVIIKAHPAHYGTGALVAAAVMRAVEKNNMPKGVFSLLYDDGYEAGQQLAKHPLTKAVAFTGSEKGGMALVDTVQKRREPVPVFVEMGSINPVLFFPEAFNKRGAELAGIFAGSVTLGAGQFCTNPGLMLAVASPGLDKFKHALAQIISAAPSATMLSDGIAENYNRLSDIAFSQKEVALLAASDNKVDGMENQAIPKIATVTAENFISNPHLHKEIFGPCSILVTCNNIQQLEAVIDALEGQLTVTVIAKDEELHQYKDLLNQLQRKTGRMILNGMPTGVEVCASMQHGGPFPATNDSRFTSVGTSAIYRFVRPFAWQNWKQDLLPDELKDANPLRIRRLVNNKSENHYER